MEQEKPLHEKNRYADQAFPIGVYTVTKEKIVPKGRGYLDLHWHEELQLTLVTRGRLTMRVNAAEYVLQAGQAIFINRNLLHVTADMSADGQYVSLNFPDKLLGFFPGSRMEQDWVLPYTGNCAFLAVILKKECEWQNRILKDLFDVLHMLAVSGADFEYLVPMRLTGIWYTLISNIRENIRVPSRGYIRKQDRMREMLTFIHANYTNAIQLKEIAAAANISEAECCRSFSGLVGMSPGQYLLSYRVSRAMELLSSTDMTATEVTFAVGFNDASYFIRCFKEKTGKTPKEYRKHLVPQK